MILGSCAAFFAVGGNAMASVITVDDDRAECSVADYTSVSTAVAMAAQGDKIYICPGTYTVPGGESSQGLKIEKNISLLGAGSDKVFLEPDGSAPSMAAAVPSERDEYGNIITVKRRLVQLFDVEISGLTVRANGTAVEAGIAMIDVSEGRISDVVVEGLVPGSGPGTGLYEPPELLASSGNGIVVANITEAVQNEIWISDTEISGFNKAGIVADNRLINGSDSVGNNSALVTHVEGSTITGAGPSSPIGQNGIVSYGSGAKLLVSDSKITGTGAVDGSSAAIYLLGTKVTTSKISGVADDANDLSGNQYGIVSKLLDDSGLAPDTLDATHNWFGDPAISSTANVTTAPAAVAAPPAPAGAGDPADSAPTLDWDTGPDDGDTVYIDGPVPLDVLAVDDFGITDVEYFANGDSLGVAPTPALDGDRVWSKPFIPTLADSGETIELTIVATDSKGQTDELSVTVEVSEQLPSVIKSITGKPAKPVSPLKGYDLGLLTSGLPGTAVYKIGSTTMCTVSVDPYTCEYLPTSSDVGSSTLTVTLTNEFGQIATATAPLTVNKFSNATITGTAVRAGPGGSVTVSGTILLPTNVFAADACVGDVSVKHAANTGVAPVAPDCTFSVVMPPRAKNAVVLRFSNDVLSAIKKKVPVTTTP